MFCRQQREKKLDVFFPAENAQDVCWGEVTPHFNALLLLAPFRKDCNSFSKEITNSGNIAA
jgi:hypothetical protein